MTLNVDFTPEQAARLAAAAKRQGLESQNILQRLVTEHLPEPPERAASAEPPIDAENAAAIAYLDRRLREEATDDPEETRRLIAGPFEDHLEKVFE